MLTNDLSILLESKEPPLDILTDPKTPRDLTEDVNVQRGLNTTDDPETDADMCVVGPNGDAPASATTPALTSPADTSMS